MGECRYVCVGHTHVVEAVPCHSLIIILHQLEVFRLGVFTFCYLELLIIIITPVPLALLGWQEMRYSKKCYEYCHPPHLISV